MIHWLVPIAIDTLLMLREPHTGNLYVHYNASSETKNASTYQSVLACLSSNGVVIALSTLL